MLTFFITGSVSFFANPITGATQTALLFFKTQPVDPFTAGAIFAGGATSIAVLLFIGAAGKSAQIRSTFGFRTRWLVQHPSQR